MRLTIERGAASISAIAGANSVVAPDLECPHLADALDGLRRAAPFVRELYGNNFMRLATTAQQARFLHVLLLLRLTGESAVLELVGTLCVIAQLIAPNRPSAGTSTKHAEPGENELYDFQFEPMIQRLFEFIRLYPSYQSPVIASWMAAPGPSGATIQLGDPRQLLRAWIYAFRQGPQAVRHMEVCSLQPHLNSIREDIRAYGEGLSNLYVLNQRATAISWEENGADFGATTGEPDCDALLYLCAQRRRQLDAYTQFAEYASKRAD